jgi:hypothetical protein
VPPGVCVSTDSHVGIGGTSVFNRDGGGIDADWTDERSAPEGTPRSWSTATSGSAPSSSITTSTSTGTARRQQGVRMTTAAPTSRPSSPASGLVVFGAVLLADALDAIHLSFAALAPLACFLVGDILLAAGLTRRD